LLPFFFKNDGYLRYKALCPTFLRPLANFFFCLIEASSNRCVGLILMLKGV
jgi:hypothetical protein